MPDVNAADARAWAQKHGVVLSATPVSPTEDGDEIVWRLEAKTCEGTLAVDIETTGYQPDPFDALFGWWAIETPDDDQYDTVVEVVGSVAVGDLARLLGWR